MPQIIHPHVTGTITITLTNREAAVLSDALNSVLERDAPEWTMMRVRDLSYGKTLNTFKFSLDSALSGKY